MAEELPEKLMSKRSPYSPARMARTVLLVLLPLLSFEPAFAAGVGEAFRSFIVGAGSQTAIRAPGLDASSQACLSCHDGSRASHVTIRSAGSPLQIRGSQTLNHPVGMVYDQSATRRPQDYRPRASLPPNIRLVNGQVSCVSCHATRNDLTLASAGDELPTLASTSTCTATRQLTTGRRDRDLCLACHNK